MKQVGLIGCGVMGQGIASNLRANGYEVFIYDNNPNIAEWCRANGFTPYASPKELGRDVEVIVTSLPGPAIVKDVLLGEDGVFSTLRPNSCILDMSTIDPVTSRELFNRAREKQIHFFDCPVSGGPAGAHSGTLTIMVGGDEAQLAPVRPLLETMGKEIIYVGQSGAGQIAKLTHNMLVAAITVGLAEAFAVAAKAGVSPETLAKVIDSGTAHNRVLAVFGPTMLQRTFEQVKFSLAHMHKDIHLYTKTAFDYGVPSFLGTLVAQLYEAAKANGKGHLDSSAVYQTILEMANMEEKT